ncbi:ankyrin repeat domain-containing protein 50 [Scleropages formosus]|uniref:Ankyrin repeat domain 50-like n=1 Tax=Scleropages formosus TaxID=113540 RepID=A0A8C9SGK9_SCLFO|nr:ankyrin repeat domain-containing protein 50-like [Scleropages formosus]
MNGSLFQGRRFLCREWALEKLKQLLESRPPGVLLSGGPGAGKTALCAEVVRPTSEAGLRVGLAARCLAAHFCQREDERSLDVWRFVLGLVEQLCSSPILPPAYRAALEDPGVAAALEPEYCQQNPDEAFKRAVLLPLLDIPAPPQNLFILVDSLELGRDGPGESPEKAGRSSSIAELLSSHLQLLPCWLSLVGSTRRQDKVIPKMFPGLRKLVLDDLRKALAVRDVQQYILRRLEREGALRRHLTPETADMLNLLHIKSSGCFLFLERVLDGVAEGLLAVREIRHIPGTLSGLYLWLCQRLFPRMLFSQVQPLLSILLAAPRPLTPDQLYRAVWTGNTTLSFAQFKHQLDLLSVLLADGPGDTKVLFHRSFAEWLTDVKYCTQKFLCSVAEGHTMLAMALSLRGLDLSSEEACQLASHLVQSQVHVEKPELLALWMVWVGVPPVSGCHPVSPQSCRPPVTLQPEVLQLLVMAGVVPSSCLPDGGRSEGGTLRRALEREDSVRILLDGGASVNQTDPTDGRTLLANAAHMGSADVAQLLLTRGADLELVDFQGQTPLILAARQGHAKVLLALLDWAAQHGLEVARMVNHADNEGWTALRSAAWAGHVEMVRMLLDAGAEVDGSDSEGRTALRAAAWAGHEDVLLTLLNKGAQVDQPDREGRTPLVAAAYMGHRDAVEILLDAGAEVDRPDGDGRTALSVAAMCVPSAAGGNRGDVVSLLLERGADPGHRDRDNMTPLLLAAYEGHVEVVELLLEAGADVDESTAAHASGAITPLLAAASMGHMAAVSAVLFWGAAVDAIDSEGRTALSLAATRGSTDVVRALLDRGLDENHKDHLGWTPLHAAACGGHKAVCAALTDSGSVARVGELDNEGHTPLILAAQEGHCNAVRMLLDRRSPIDHRGYDGHSALSAAALEGHTEVVELLMRRGADTDVRDAEGRPLLYLLVLEGRLDIAALLVEKGGAPLESRDSEGRTALHVASWKGDLEAMALLLSHGADPNAQDEDGRAPLHSAAWRGQAAAARMLLEARGALVDLACRQQGATALCIAAQEGHAGVVAVLLEKEADPDHVDQYGRSPVKVAGKRGHVNIVRMLESYGAKPYPGLLPSSPCSNPQSSTVKTQSSTGSGGTTDGSCRPLQGVVPSLSSCSCSPGSTAERFHSMQSSQASSSTCHSLATVQTVPADSLSFTLQIQQHSLPRSRSRPLGSTSGSLRTSSHGPRPPASSPPRDRSPSVDPQRLPKGFSVGWDPHIKVSVGNAEQESEEKGWSAPLFGGGRWNSVMTSLGVMPGQDCPARAAKTRESPPLGYPSQREVEWRSAKSVLSPPFSFPLPTCPGALPPESLMGLSSTNPELNLKQAIKLQFEGPTSALAYKRETPL